MKSPEVATDQHQSDLGLHCLVTMIIVMAREIRKRAISTNKYQNEGIVRKIISIIIRYNIAGIFSHHLYCRFRQLSFGLMSYLMLPIFEITTMKYNTSRIIMGTALVNGMS